MEYSGTMIDELIRAVERQETTSEYTHDDLEPEAASAVLVLSPATEQFSTAGAA